MQYVNHQDRVDRYINGFATQSFRDQADRDYIAARLACRAELMPQWRSSSVTRTLEFQRYPNTLLF